MEQVANHELLQQLSTVTNALAGKPRNTLVPFERDLITLSCQMRIIATNIEAHRGSNDKVDSDGEEPDEFDQSPPLNILQPTSPAGLVDEENNPPVFRSNIAQGHTVSRSQHSKVHVQQLVSSAAARFACQRRSLQQLSNNPFTWFHKDERFQHLQSIFIFEQRQRAYRVTLKERLLLICSCMSLAQEFRDYESRNGWIPKQEALISAILREESPSVQQIGKHFQSFQAAINLTAEDYRKVDAGVRLGTKLKVLDAIGKFSGVGTCLPLALGFEVSKLSRLSYNDFVHFWTVLSTEEAGRSIRRSSAELEPWWVRCRTTYDETFGKARMESRAASPEQADGGPANLTHRLSSSSNAMGECSAGNASASIDCRSDTSLCTGSAGFSTATVLSSAGDQTALDLTPSYLGDPAAVGIFRDCRDEDWLSDWGGIVEGQGTEWLDMGMDECLA